MEFVTAFGDLIGVSTSPERLWLGSLLEFPCIRSFMGLRPRGYHDTQTRFSFGMVKRLALTFGGPSMSKRASEYDCRFDCKEVGSCLFGCSGSMGSCKRECQFLDARTLAFALSW